MEELSKKAKEIFDAMAPGHIYRVFENCTNEMSELVQSGHILETLNVNGDSLYMRVSEK